MTKKQETAIAAGALTLGAVLLSRGMRAARTFDFRDKSVLITGARGLALEMARQLGNEGGIITLLDNKGLKVDGIAYTGEQAKKEGWTLVF